MLLQNQQMFLILRKCSVPGWNPKKGGDCLSDKNNYFRRVKKNITLTASVIAAEVSRDCVSPNVGVQWGITSYHIGRRILHGMEERECRE